VRAGYYGDADLRDSTVADNGGWALSGDVELYNATVTGNNGVLEEESYYYPATFSNSVIADNPRQGGGPECSPAHPPESKGGNVFSTGSECAAKANEKDVVVDDARLGKLADNGGATPTVALKKGSPAIGQATKTATKRDQRGVKRGKDPDSGAFERRPFNP
jgi:hypothetical protein